MPAFTRRRRLKQELGLWLWWDMAIITGITVTGTIAGSVQRS
ncbi:MAG: hypothetical protein ABSG84_00525 [Acidobacteriaceae bacterium]